MFDQPVTGPPVALPPVALPPVAWPPGVGAKPALAFPPGMLMLAGIYAVPFYVWSGMLAYLYDPD
jgi:hypothetical protein